MSLFLHASVTAEILCFYISAITIVLDAAVDTEFRVILHFLIAVVACYFSEFLPLWQVEKIR